MNRVPLVYIAGRFRAPTKAQRQLNIHEAEVAAIECVNRDWVPLVPHRAVGCLYGAITEGQAMRACCALIERCDCMLVISDSEGTQQEIEFAKHHEPPIPVYYRIEDIPAGAG